MSGICGIFNLNGSPVCQNTLAALNNTLKDYGGDGEGLWLSDNIGFGHKMSHLTIESTKETLPYFVKTRQVAITADIRLFNRRELCSKLNLIDSLDLSDSQIVLALYCKYDKAFCEHLLGEYSIALWDGVKKELICVTDHFNHLPFYYYQDNNIFVFASSIDTLNSLPQVKRNINFRRIALSSYFMTQEMVGETNFTNIKYIPAASILSICRNGSNDVKHYWKPELPPVQHFNSEAEFTEAFQEVFSLVLSGATRTHLQVCSLFSGGLDSSGITAMAAEVLARQNRELTSLSAVLPDDYAGNEHDERYFINLLQKDNLTKLNITDPERGPFDDLHTFTTSYSSSSRHYLFRAFNAASRKIGAKIILDGALGEIGPTYYNDEYLGELFRKFKYGKLIYNIRQHQKLYKRSLKSILFHDVLKPNLSPAWQSALHTRRDLDHITQFSLVKKEFIHKYISLAELEKEEKQLKSVGTRPGTDGRYNNFLLLQTIFNIKGPSCAAFNEFGKQKIRYSYPYLDKRLFEFCLSVPNELRYKNGYRRYIIRRGMQGVMPDELCYRTSKEPFSPDYHIRYKKQLPIAKQLLSAFKSNPLINEVIDIKRLQEYFNLEMNSNRCSDGNDFIGMHSLPEAIYLASFLANNS